MGGEASPESGPHHTQLLSGAGLLAEPAQGDACQADTVDRPFGVTSLAQTTEGRVAPLSREAGLSEGSSQGAPARVLSGSREDAPAPPPQDQPHYSWASSRPTSPAGCGRPADTGVGGQVAASWCDVIPSDPYLVPRICELHG